ncbi:MAG: ROK family protein [bacterium]
MRILVIDIGGTHVKVLLSGKRVPRRIDSGPSLTPSRMVNDVKRLAADWPYHAISIGYPGVVVHERIAAEPRNLGRGWVGFDFAEAFGCPVKLTNDAAMQALGSYTGGRMLFLGLGTGLGSAMIVDGRLEPMELAHLPYRKGRTYEDYVGATGLKRLGAAKWRKHVWTVVATLRAALEPDYVVVGGGNAKRLHRPPPGVRLGKNSNAFLGGFRLWRAAKRDGARRRSTPRA